MIITMIADGESCRLFQGRVVQGKRRLLAPGQNYPNLKGDQHAQP